MNVFFSSKYVQLHRNFHQHPRLWPPNVKKKKEPKDVKYGKFQPNTPSYYCIYGLYKWIYIEEYMYSSIWIDKYNHLHLYFNMTRYIYIECIFTGHQAKEERNTCTRREHCNCGGSRSWGSRASWACPRHWRKRSFSSLINFFLVEANNWVFFT